MPGGVSPVKIFAALGRFVHRPEPPTPPAKPFDDGLVEIARLIAREVPARDGAEAPARAPANSRDSSPGGRCPALFSEAGPARYFGPARWRIGKPDGPVRSP
jgi:hypothetical protein